MWPILLDVAGMLYGEADALNSSYHISYNMLLNMLRVEDADPDFLVKSSFHQFQQEASAPALEASLNPGLLFRSHACSSVAFSVIVEASMLMRGSKAGEPSCCCLSQEEARELDAEKAKVAAGLNDEERTSEYFLVREQLERTRADISRVIQRPHHCLPYIQVGTL